MLHTISYKSKLIDMKRVLLILSLLICSITSSFGQRNYAQELVDLLRQGKCFEALEFREQYANRLPLHDEAFDLLYKSHMSLFLINLIAQFFIWKNYLEIKTIYSIWDQQLVRIMGIF